MTHNEIIKKASESTGIDYTIVDRTYKAFWLFIKETIKSWPLKEDYTEEQFKELRTSINIPSIGKIGISWDRYKNLRKRRQIIRQRVQEKKKRLKESNNEDKEDTTSI